MSKLITIDDIEFKINDDDFHYDYQTNLTKKLDRIRTDFNQSMINEIILWKTNRYAVLSHETFSTLNKINFRQIKINKTLTQKILRHLLKEKGVRLPVASTILRFKNPKIYQIIDQRIYRILYGQQLTLSSSKSEHNIEAQINLYLEYLRKLREVTNKLNINFKEADRILYNIDKRLNSEIKINY